MNPDLNNEPGSAGAWPLDYRQEFINFYYSTHTFASGSDILYNFPNSDVDHIRTVSGSGIDSKATCTSISWTKEYGVYRSRKWVRIRTSVPSLQRSTQGAGSMSSGARRVGQRVFDWAKLASRVPEEARAEFNSFRARHEACKAR